MRTASLVDTIISFFIHKLSLCAMGLSTLFLLAQPTFQVKEVQFESQVFNVELSHFSPAFAAFEDDYLFNEDTSLKLQAGSSPKIYKKLLVQNKASVQKNRPPADWVQVIFNRFDGSDSLFSIRNNLQEQQNNLWSKLQVQAPSKASTKNKIKMANEEMKFGSLVAMVAAPQHSKKTLKKRNFSPKKRSKNPPGPANEETVDPHSNTDKEPAVFDEYKIFGNIQLKEGLAFLGSMEVSWVVGDHELQLGSINVPDATYEIEVSQLIGDVILSLYDNNDELIGEGFVDLTKLPPHSDHFAADIEVRPIDWNHAGTVISSESLGTQTTRPLADVDITLYSFNDMTQTDALGRFEFPNWKKAQSRTLALASKAGYRDSIFMLDSKVSSEVILFSESYIQAFHKYLEELNIFSVNDMGMVYGQIRGVANVAGLEVRLEKATPIYFMEAGLATLEQKSTSKNGLFAFVGLQDGDYELFVEKDGETLDHRIVVVEQGKVSPVQVDLSKVKKHLEFFDPLNPDRSIDGASLSFFDGSYNVSLDKSNRASILINSGNHPEILEMDTSVAPSRTLVSRNKGLQRVPFIQDKQLMDLAKSQDMILEDGLLIGFIESDVPFSAAMAEQTPEKIVYFDRDGKLLDPNQPAYGFIMNGFSEGLSSIFIESIEDKTVLGSDLVFSEHDSISVIHLSLLPLE